MARKYATPQDFKQALEATLQRRAQEARGDVDACVNVMSSTDSSRGFVYSSGTA